ncbi:MAG TPA: hypothetical protein VFO29_05495 [Candidatus Rubrimentiphilum sp.]|nr:hypothetical protein [Candidatus Rubrimentiphilum sp.]
MRFRDGSGPVWMFASLALIGGYYGITARYENALEGTSAAAHELQARIAINDRTLTRSAALRGQERIAQNDLARLSRENRLPRSTAELLERVATLGRLFDVRVVSLTAQRESVAPAKTPESLLATQFTMEVQGEFASLLHFIQDLPRRKTLIGIDGAQLAVRTSGAQTRATLSATIHATLYRLAIR